MVTKGSYVVLDGKKYWVVSVVSTVDSDGRAVQVVKLRRRLGSMILPYFLLGITRDSLSLAEAYDRHWLRVVTKPLAR